MKGNIKLSYKIKLLWSGIPSVCKKVAEGICKKVSMCKKFLSSEYIFVKQTQANYLDFIKIVFYSYFYVPHIFLALKYDESVIWLQVRAVAFPNQNKAELFCLQIPLKYFKKTKICFNLKSIKSVRRDEWMGLAVSWNVGHSPENVHALVNSKLSHNLKSSPIICTLESSKIKFLRYSIFESTILIFIKDAWAVSRGTFPSVSPKFQSC